MPTLRRPRKSTTTQINASDTESQLPSSPASPPSSSLSLSSSPSPSPSPFMGVKNTSLPTRHHQHQQHQHQQQHPHSSARKNPLNVYKEDYDRKGASFKIILFILATTCYTAFLYSGARCAMCDVRCAIQFLRCTG